uniref:Peroxisomal membrane protein PEX16 n=1 Tax=Blastobotrys adeninivorans TaxID=409370 RepID=A0A060TAP6_BLAAD
MSSVWLEKYQQFLLKNASQISSIESSLRSLTFILPGRFKDVEVASESLYSILQILGLYHDAIITKAAKKLVAIDPSFRTGAHNRYAEHQMSASKTYRALALCIQLTRYTELLWEMIARRKKGAKARWLVVLWIEVVKASLRLALFASTKRPLLSPPLIEREVDPSHLELDKDDNIVNEKNFGITGQDRAQLQQYEQAVLENKVSATWKMPRSGYGISTIIPVHDIDGYLSAKVLGPEDVKPPPELLHKLASPRAVVAEITYILRPVIYASLAYRYRNSKHSWTPWVVGAAIEYAARSQLMQSYKQDLPGGHRSLTKLEADELQRRGMALWWWLMRGAMYEGVTGPLIRGALRKVAWVPGSGLVGSVIEDYLYLVDNYHFASSSL